MLLNTLRQNGRHFPDDIFKCIFLNENGRISINISLKFVPKVPINNIPAMVQIMAWRRPGDKPLSEPMMVSLPTHICVARPQWVKLLSRRTFLTNQLNCWRFETPCRSSDATVMRYCGAQLAHKSHHFPWDERLIELCPLALTLDDLYISYWAALRETWLHYTGSNTIVFLKLCSTFVRRVGHFGLIYLYPTMFYE